MRKIFRVLCLLILIYSQASAQHQPLSLDDFFVKGSFRTQRVYGLRSMNDGEHYTVLEGSRSRIVKYSYKTGQAVETLLDLQKIEDSPVKLGMFETLDNNADKYSTG